MQALFKTLKLNGKAISLMNADGSWFVAVKPICEALGVSFSGQSERIKRHLLFSQLYVPHVWLAADNKQREMMCLPEKYIYGWLLTINSDNGELMEYQQKCYDILYNHFHGQLTYRYNTLCDKESAEAEIAALEDELKNDSRTQRISELKAKKKGCNKILSDLDTDLVTGQTLLVLN